MEKQGIKSLIIDLRNNGGGIVDSALTIADYITDKDSVLLYEVDKNGEEEVKKSENKPIINMPIVILTNENKIGIEPDEKVELPDKITNVLNIDEKDDTQLQKAIELLK